MKKIALNSLISLKSIRRYLISIVALSGNVFATNLYMELDRNMNVPDLEFKALSKAEKHQCIEGISRLSKKLKFENKQIDELQSSFIANSNSISFPTKSGEIIILQSTPPFQSKKFSPPKESGIYEFNFYEDRFRFTTTPKSKCASTVPIKNCDLSDLKVQKTMLDGTNVEEEEISKYLYTGLVELEEVLKKTKESNPSFSLLSTELKSCMDSLISKSDQKTQNERFSNVQYLLSPDGFYAGGVGGSSGGGTVDPKKPSRSISSESSTINQ